MKLTGGVMDIENDKPTGISTDNEPSSAAPCSIAAVPLSVGSLFSGIGGFDLGFERAGMVVKWQVEIDPFCNKVLEKHWPNVKRYGDIKDVGKHNLEPVDLICGGFPCQPFSHAGKRKGKGDDRYLWPEMFRVISEIRPTWVIGENVSGFINMELDNCVAELEAEGYEVQPIVIPACAVGAPHRRDRVWILARRKDVNDTQSGGCGVLHTENIRQSAGEVNSLADADCDATHPTSINVKWPIDERNNGMQPEGQDRNTNWDEPWIEVATRLCRVDDGVSNRVHRLKALGNAVVPQIVEILGRVIIDVESKSVLRRQ
jgi:DNA (cytosine-5)-methyltransferase 1